VRSLEVCHNPLKSDCQSSDIVVYIQVGSERFPICRQCWSDLAESDVEWGEEGLKDNEKKADLTLADQDDVNLADEKKTASPVKRQIGQAEEQNEHNAGEMFLEELSKTMSSE